MHFKNLNWILNLLLLIILTTLLAACGGQDETEAPTASAVIGQEQEATAAPSAQTDKTADTPEPVVQEQVIEDQAPIERREATTVLAAAQILDLRGVSLPTEIKSMGQNEVGYLSFEVPTDDVASVVDLYQPYFIDQGWQNNADHEYTSETTANRYFQKDGFTISLSISNSGESTRVTFVNQGNIDLRALPQTTDAELLYQFPNTLGYVSPAAVSDVADFTRQELATQGWQEFTQPNTASAQDADTQNLTFIQNGLELSAFIGLAPAQGNKTSVQYTLTLLPLDLPIYDEVIGLEYDKHTSYVSYQTPADVDALVQFYRENMTVLGWDELPETAIVMSEEAKVFFANEAERLALMLEITAADGQRVATLRPFGADETLASAEPGPDAAEVETPDVADTSTDLQAINLPLAADAESVEHDDLSEQITFSSASDIETLVDFYRQALTEQGWQEDEDFSFVDEAFASLDFAQREALLTVDMLNDGSGVTEVTLYGSGLVWDANDSGEGTDDSDDSEELSLIEEDELFLPSDNSGYFSEGSQFSIIANITSPSEVEALAKLYQTGLPDYGWQETGVTTGSETELYFVKDDQELNLQLRPLGSETEIEFVLRDPVAAAEAGILPPAGQTKLMVINFTEDTLMMTINQQTLEIPGGGAEIEDPADVPQFDVPPGQHTITTVLPDGQSLTDTAEVGANEVWTLWTDEEGVLPVRLY